MFCSDSCFWYLLFYNSQVFVVNMVKLSKDSPSREDSLSQLLGVWAIDTPHPSAPLSSCVRFRELLYWKSCLACAAHPLLLIYRRDNKGSVVWNQARTTLMSHACSRGSHGARGSRYQLALHFHLFTCSNLLLSSLL